MPGRWYRQRVAIACVIAVVTLGFAVAGCDVAPTVQRELMSTTKSPDGHWVVRVLYVNPGAAGSASVVVEATPASGGTATPIARIGPDELERAKWADDDKLSVKWLSSSELSVGGYPASVPAR